MRIMLSTWGGRAESGFLEVDMALENGTLKLTYTGEDRYDGCNPPEIQSRTAFTTTRAADSPTKAQLFEYIREDLAAHKLDFWHRTVRIEDMTFDDPRSTPEPSLPEAQPGPTDDAGRIGMERASHTYTDRVTLGDDGVYRWYYDMDMYRNKSILHTLLKVNCFLFPGIMLVSIVMFGILEHDFFAPIVRGMVVVSLCMWALLSLLYIGGFYLAAWLKGGRYRVFFELREDGVNLVWPEKLDEAFDTGAKAMRVLGAATGSRRLGGRWRPTLKEVSDVSFNTVVNLIAYPQWDMLDLVVIGGKFQIYAMQSDMPLVRDFVMARIPKGARARAKI